MTGPSLPVCEICGDPILGARRSDARFHPSCRRDAARVAASEDFHLIGAARAFWTAQSALRSRRSPRRIVTSSPGAVGAARGLTTKELILHGNS